MNATATATQPKARQADTWLKNCLSETKKATPGIKSKRRDQLILDHLPLVSAIAAHVQKSLARPY